MKSAEIRRGQSGDRTVKKRYFAFAAAASLTLVGTPALAKGCLKRAAVGGVAGHYAGHHAVMGAAAGCSYGHHRAKVAARAARQQAAQGRSALALHQPRHQLDEIAGAETAVELVLEDHVPTVLHRAGRAGQREDIGAAGDAGAGARLDRRGADLVDSSASGTASPKPGIIFSATASTASGVTSRPVTPVPPVVMTHVDLRDRRSSRASRSTIASTSSRSIARSARTWPAPVSRSTSVSPDRSSARPRVSDTVRTAMRTGRNSRVSSIGISARLRPTVLRRRREPRSLALRDCDSGSPAFAGDTERYLAPGNFGHLPCASAARLGDCSRPSLASYIQ